MTKAELEERIKALEVELDFAHRVIEKLGADFLEIETKMTQAEQVLRGETR